MPSEGGNTSLSVGLYIPTMGDQLSPVATEKTLELCF